MAIHKTIPVEAAERVKDLGYRVRLARTRRSMSIAEVAAKAGINRHAPVSADFGPAIGFGRNAGTDAGFMQAGADDW
jgi:hypothetical protein